VNILFAAVHPTLKGISKLVFDGGLDGPYRLVVKLSWGSAGQPASGFALRQRENLLE
jgi:hypothetical protein